MNRIKRDIKNGTKTTIKRINNDIQTTQKNGDSRIPYNTNNNELIIYVITEIN